MSASPRLTPPRHVVILCHPEQDSFNAAIAAKVAFVPGASFYANAAPTNTFRLSFVTVPPERIALGIATLGRLIAARM